MNPRFTSTFRSSSAPFLPASLGRILGVLLVFAGSLSAAWGQVSPKDQAKAFVGLRASVKAAANYQFRVYSESTAEADPLALTTHTNQAGLTTAVTSPTSFVKLIPGQLYHIAVTSTSWASADFLFNAPPGYTVRIGESTQARSARITHLANPPAGGNGTTIFDLELQPQDGAARLAAGFSSAPSIGDVLWAVGVGALQNGRYAGVLRWRQSAISQDLLDPLSLIYADPVDGDVSVSRTTDGAIASITTWAVAIEVTRDTAPAVGYTITARPPWDGSTVFRQYHVYNPDSTWQNRVRIDVTSYDTDLTRYDQWTLSQQGNVTQLLQQDGQQANGLRRIETVSRAATAGNSDTDSGDTFSADDREEVVTLYDGNATTAVLRTRRVFRLLFKGQPQEREELIREIADPEKYFDTAGTNQTQGTALKWVTRYDYYHETATATGSYTKLRSVTRADGSWEAYRYFGDATGDADDAVRWGQLAAIYRPWQDNTGVSAATATDGNCRATLFDYAVSRTGGVWCELPARSETKILGTTTAKRTLSYAFWTSADGIAMPGLSLGAQPMRTETIQDYYGTGTTSSLATTRKVFHLTADPAVAGRLWAQINPDGTITSVCFTYDAGDDRWREHRFLGTAAQPSGQTSAQVTQYFSGGPALEPVWMVAGKSRVETLARDVAGHTIEETVGIYTAAGVISEIGIGRSYSNEGYLVSESKPFDEGTETSYVNGRVAAQTNRLDRTAVSFNFDSLMRVTYRSVAGAAASAPYAAQSAIDTTYTYDAAGHELTATTTAGTLSLVTTTTYNRVGLPTDRTDERGLVTNLAYADGGRTVTTTFPGATGSRPTKIVSRYLDGSPRSTTGTAEVSVYSGSTVNPDGTITRETRPVAETSPRWSRVTTDWLGRTTKEERPASSGTFTKEYYYNTLGQLTKTTEPNLADTLFTYNSLGERELSGLDLNHNGTLDPSSTDRISKVQTEFPQGSTRRKRTLSSLYATDYSTTLSQVGETLEAMDTEIVASAKNTGLVYGYDLFGNLTTKGRIQISNGTGPALLKLVTDLPDSTTDEVTTLRNGLVQTKQTAQGLTTSYVYDALRRIVEENAPRVGVLKTAYYTTTAAAAGNYAIYTTNAAANGQVAWRKDAAGNQTTYAYSATDGRLTSETNALNKAVYYAYDLRGQIIRQWGAASYPVEYGYNDYGERTTMRTFRTAVTEHTTAAWGAATYPSTTGDLTTWTFEAATGSLLAKTDAVTTEHSAGKTVTYTYNIRGQLATRTWGRNVTTTYRYFGDGFVTTGEVKTGELRAIEYSDGTPTVAYTYNRLGQRVTVSQAASGFNLSTTLENSLSGKVTQETWDATYFSGRLLTRVLDTATTGAKGRTAGYKLGVAGNLGAEQDIAYGYDASGRFNAVGLTGQSTTYAYGYTANSNLLASVNESASGYAQLFTYEGTRDHVATVEGKFGVRILGGVAYEVDGLGRRTTSRHYGEIFGRYVGLGHHTAYGYNDRSEVTSEQTWTGQTLTDTTSALAGRGYGYAYDPIGNRTTASVDGATTSTYTANALNQYSSRTVAGSVSVAGFAPPAETVTVKANGADQGTVDHPSNYFHKAVSASNGSGPVWLSLETSTATGGTATRTAFVPPATEASTYDDDGNLTGDGRWTYTWDAENRLTTMETNSVASGAGAPRQFLTFKYDYLGRRIRKTVANWNGTAYVTAVDRKFIYDGWNLIAEYDVLTTFTLARTYVWGLDISRTLADAGGVHGLLQIKDASTNQTYQTIYDGNGNVLGLVQRSNGALVAQYEYSPFGETIRASGSYAASNPFRFSTKFTDTETGLVYFGRRYYDPRKGRFISRDPKEEFGGRHLYGFVTNNPVNRWDYLGMYDGFLACGYAQGQQNWMTAVSSPSAWVLAPSSPSGPFNSSGSLLSSNLSLLQISQILGSNGSGILSSPSINLSSAGFSNTNVNYSVLYNANASGTNFTSAGGVQFTGFAQQFVAAVNSGNTPAIAIPYNTNGGLFLAYDIFMNPTSNQNVDARGANVVYLVDHGHAAGQYFGMGGTLRPDAPVWSQLSTTMASDYRNVNLMGCDIVSTRDGIDYILQISAQNNFNVTAASWTWTYNADGSIDSGSIPSGGFYATAAPDGTVVYKDTSGNVIPNPFP